MAGTETKATRVERLKRELNPWEAYAEIQRFAREGWDAIPPEWLGTYFRWWGIYTQGDGIGAIGGKGGEGKATRHFMVRIRIPNGQLQAHQLRTIAGLAERYARGIADITRSEEHTSELQSPCNIVCRLLLEKKNRSVRQSRWKLVCPVVRDEINLWELGSAFCAVYERSWGLS